MCHLAVNEHAEYLAIQYTKYLHIYQLRKTKNLVFEKLCHKVLVYHGDSISLIS
jgi:hypothetical protein